MEHREIAPGVYGLGSEQVNWYLIEDGGRFSAVDAGLPGFARDLDGDLARLGVPRGDIAAVVLTHSDGDHTGLAPVLRESGARVLIHAADDASLRKPGPKGGGDADLLLFGHGEPWRGGVRAAVASARSRSANLGCPACASRSAKSAPGTGSRTSPRSCRPTRRCG